MHFLAGWLNHSMKFEKHAYRPKGIKRMELYCNPGNNSAHLLPHPAMYYFILLLELILCINEQFFEEVI